MFLFFYFKWEKKFRETPYISWQSTSSERISSTSFRCKERLFFSDKDVHVWRVCPSLDLSKKIYIEALCSRLLQEGCKGTIECLGCILSLLAASCYAGIQSGKKSLSKIGSIKEDLQKSCLQLITGRVQRYDWICRMCLKPISIPQLVD